MQRKQLLNTLKKTLRAQKLTYDDVAEHLDVSRATVKRLFGNGDVTLSRLEEICELAGLQLSELVDTMASEEPLISELTREQERELAGNPKLLLMCYLLINRWPMDEITRIFEIDEDESKILLRRLRDLKLIEILPFDRIKVLTAHNFDWRADGPVQQYFLDQVQRDFFDDGFDGKGEVRYVLGGLLSEPSRHRIVRAMNRIANEIDELSRQDIRLPRHERQSFGAVVAIRAWEFSEFTDLRRPKPQPAEEPSGSSQARERLRQRVTGAGDPRAPILSARSSKGSLKL